MPPSPIGLRHDSAPHLPSLPLKRKPFARGKRAPRVPSIVDGLSPLPSQESGVDTVVPDACHLAHKAARALLKTV